MKLGGILSSRGSQWVSRRIAPAMTVTMAIGLLSTVPAQADPAGKGQPAVSNPDRKVKGKRLGVKSRKTATRGMTSAPLPAPRWPKAGTAQVAVPAATQDGKRRPSVKAADLPVWVSAPGASRKGRTVGAAAGRVSVRMLDRAAASKTGLDGPVFTVERTDSATAPGRVGVGLDYSGFADASGGSYGSRLRLVRLPACVLTTPNRPECRTRIPVAAHNDTQNKRLQADIEAAPTKNPVVQAPAPSASPAPTAAKPSAAPTRASATPRGRAVSSALTAAGAEATVLAVTAGASGGNGDYKATSLSASATWQVGTQSGAFSWSYPMQVPPVPGALTPEVAIGYSSSTVDGKTSNTNGQSSWVGEGFDLWPGYIQRSYKSCEDDDAPKDEWGNSPGDQCWGYDNATISWNGKAGELIPDGSNQWRLKQDDGSRIEKLTDSAVANGDNDNEYWKVTTTDGTQYFFGRNRLPGWTSGKTETDSTWTVPVYGDDSGEPCHDSTFATSSCRQAWRWNLDYVVDRNGNAITYYYGTETNHYGRNLKPEDETPYIRGGYLKSISYGLRSDALFASPPAKVDFTTSERCIPTDTFDCAETKIDSDRARWEDVPWDLNCDSGEECKDGHGTVAPTFWSRKRLTTVTTQVIKADGSGYRDVDSWDIKHRWGTADADRALLPETIVHTGKAASTHIALPKVSFAYVQAPNRVDSGTDNTGPYIKYRLGTVADESGGQIDVTYSGADCTATDLPTPHTNTRRCFPVYWQHDGNPDPTLDWFHKYVVDEVIATDRTGYSPPMVTKYEYIGGTAWHYDDDDGLTKEKYKTWSQWRGYGQVRVKTGGQNDLRTRTDHLFLRGMDGDRAGPSGGTKNVNVSDGRGGTHPDHNALAGFGLKTTTFNGVGGPAVSTTVNTPWRLQTASRTRPWGTVTADIVSSDVTRSWTVLADGTERETKVDSDYETGSVGAGRPKSTNDLGDVSTSADDRCSRTTYADNPAAMMVKFPSRAEVTSAACTATIDRSTQVISDVRTFYDGGAFDAAPSKGQVTRVERLAQHDGTTPTYEVVTTTTSDDFGRPLTVTDAAGNTSSTAYTETQGLTTKITTTSPRVNPTDANSAQVSIQEIDPARGVPTGSINIANKRTDLEYDALGRLRKVWLPDRPKARGYLPSQEYTYHVADQQIVAVGTIGINKNSAQTPPSYQLFDGFLRPRQTQTVGPNGTRLISDTMYNVLGKVDRTYATYPADGAATTALFGIAQPGAVETQIRYGYDGVGRVTAERLLEGHGDAAEKWRTTTIYGGDRVSVDPPDGGTPTTTITDARGQTTEVRQYNAGSPTGDDYNRTRYTYDHAGRPATVTGPEPASHTGPDRHTWAHTYDQRGRITQQTDPDTGTTKYTYDALDRLTSVEDGRGKKVFTTYDVLGRTTQRRADSAAGTVLATWSYDTVQKGLPSASTRKTPQGDYTSTVNSYDNLGRATKTTIGIPSVTGEEALAGSYVFNTSYRPDGTVLGQSLPAAGGLAEETVVSEFDELQRPTTTSGLSSYVTKSIYSPTGKPLQYELTTDATAGKKSWLTYTYQNTTQRLSTSRVDREDIAGVDRSATYDYDPAGNITKISDVSRSGTDTQCFKHDPMRRLTDAWAQGTSECATDPGTATLGGPAPYRHAFTYDPQGNRKTETNYTANGQLASTRTYSYAGDDGVASTFKGHQLASVTQTGTGAHAETYTYDATSNTTKRAIGSTTQNLTWDTEGNLSTVSDSAKGDTTYVYTPEGDRLLRRDPGGTTLYLPGMELRQAKGSTTATATRYYSHGGATIAMRTTAGVTFLADDHQGTAQLAINAATQELTQRRFTPFGTERGTATGTWLGEKGFVGGTTDASTDLTHLGAREYDPGLGRFISVDPVFAPGDPQSWNGYAYADNNPVTTSDPSGLCPPDICGEGIINPGHDKPTKTGGCGHDCGNPPPRHNNTQSPPVKKCSWFCHAKNVTGGAASSLLNGTVGMVRSFGAELAASMVSLACPPVRWSGCYGAVQDAADESGMRDEIKTWGDESSKAYRYTKFTVDWAPVVFGGLAGLRALARVAIKHAAERAAIKAGGGLSNGKTAATAQGLPYLVADTPELTRLVNPLGGTKNCGPCSLAVDRTLAGSPTSALPADRLMYADALEELVGAKFGETITFTRVVREMHKAGDGARGIVQGYPNVGVGHFFNVVNRRGRVIFVDGQDGKGNPGVWRNYRLMRTN